jgi:hypothetical protein
MVGWVAATDDADGILCIILGRGYGLLRWFFVSGWLIIFMCAGPVDIAAHEVDPLAFMAAFAMLNYSSTIRCIQVIQPHARLYPVLPSLSDEFNDILVCHRPQSETFECVRLDKESCYVSEQVSHHPPISACWAK